MVTLYFGANAAGAGDGTSWANRAAFVSVLGSLSTLITGHDFSSDALTCVVGPGTHTLSQNVNGAIFATPPDRANHLFLRSCDASGNLWSPPKPGWTAAEPAWDTTGMPVVSMGATLAHHYISVFGLLLRSSSSSGVISATGVKASWCVLEGTGTGSGATVANGYLSNCVVRCLGSSYAAAVSMNANGHTDNVRAEGNPSATSGDRHGFVGAGGGRFSLNRCVAVDNPGHGVALMGDNANRSLTAFRCLSYGNGGDGYHSGSTTLTGNELNRVDGCVAVGNGGYGVVCGTPPGLVMGGRYRNNTSGVASGLGEGGVFGAETGAGIDADEFVDATGGDFRIKNTSALWGKGIGAGDEPAASGGGSAGTRGYWG